MSGDDTGSKVQVLAERLTHHGCTQSKSTIESLLVNVVPAMALAFARYSSDPKSGCSRTGRLLKEQ